MKISKRQRKGQHLLACALNRASTAVLALLQVAASSPSRSKIDLPPFMSCMKVDGKEVHFETMSRQVSFRQNSKQAETSLHEAHV